MKAAKLPTLLLASLLLLGSCTSSQFSGVATGAGLGGMFGSSIGGIFGGPRGHDMGTAVGMLAGGALGAVATSEKKGKSQDYTYDEQGIAYGYHNSDRAISYNVSNPWEYLEVTDVRFTDSNNNRSLDSGERATIVMEIYNRSDNTIYDIAPQITCDQRRIIISPTAIVSALEPGRGFRYRAEIIAPKRLKDGLATFSVSFGHKRSKVTAKTFRIHTGR